MSKLEDLRAWFAHQPEVLVTYSGGVDSTLVAKVAHDVLGPKALCLTAVSPSLPERERRAAESLARELGLRHEVVASHELEDPGYASNPTNRCYFCKTELYGLAASMARERGIATVVDGCNLDDLSDHRPGRQAAREHAIKSPLVECGFTKAAVREVSKELGLPTWDKPALACLSSRFPYGTAIDAEKLRQVERCEDVLVGLGFRQVRARYEGKTVRLEVGPDELARFFEPAMREQVLSGCRAAGFLYVAADLEGFRSGKMNDALVQLRPR